MALLLAKILKNSNNSYKDNVKLNLKNSVNYKFENQDKKNSGQKDND